MKTLTRSLLTAISAILMIGCSTPNPRIIEDFNFDWKFTLGDNNSFAEAEFDDSAWRDLHLPHDWAIEGQFSEKNPSRPNGGALPGGIGWYRKHFKTPEGAGQGRKIYVEFDGVFMNSTVYVNGTAFGPRPYGYSSFSYDITDVLKPEGQDNTIAVRCDNADQPNSRWYAGCGIYRDVRLVQVDDAHVAYNGVFVTTPEITRQKAKVCVRIETEGLKAGDQVTCDILNDRCQKVTSCEARKTGEGIYEAELEVGKPHLWNLYDTYQYTAAISISTNGILRDGYMQKFGIRTVFTDVDNGFIINGKEIKLKGVCLHHDMGCIGSAVHRRALERELGILKDMGVNAIRTSHNPPAPVFLDICDEMGFIVMDEAMDMWRKRKTTYDYARFFDEWHERDVKDFVQRDRNHPCVAMWSIGNEILEQNTSKEDVLSNLDVEEANILINFMNSLGQADDGENNPNVLLSRHMAQLVRDMDPTRQITSGCNLVTPTNNILRSGALDICGINYHPYLYDSCRVWFPGKAMIGSETVSSFNSRGYYVQPSTNKTSEHRRDDDIHQSTAYDAAKASWGSYHEDGWIAVRDRKWMAGTFIWTGFDYLGEPTPYGWPSRSSYFGIVDLAGFPKDAYYMYQSEWRDRVKVMHLFPHWNWSAGDKIDVWCYYNNADEVELFLNGKSLGKQSKTDDMLHAQWLGVEWEPGEITAVAYKNGRKVASDTRKTAGEVTKLKLEADRSTISADGYDLCYVTVSALDKKGIENPTADNMLHFDVSGCGELFGVDNGDATDGLCLKGSDKALFSGKALAVIRSIKGEKGSIKLTVTSGEMSKTITITSR